MICWYLLVCSKIFSLFDPYTWVPKFVNLNSFELECIMHPGQYNSGNTKVTSENLAFHFPVKTWPRLLSERHAQTISGSCAFDFWVGKISVTDQWLLMTGRLWFRTLTLKGNIHFPICWRVFRSFHHVKTTGVEAPCKNSVSIFCMKDTAPIEGDLY